MIHRTCTLLFLALTISACNTNKGSSLAGDYIAKSNCPDSGCADTTATAEKMSIVTEPGVQIRPAQKTFELSGSCNPSTYPNNRIEIEFNKTYFGAYYATSDPVKPEIAYFPLDRFGNVLLTSCKNGRFYALFSVRAAFSTTLEQFRLEIVGIDKDGNEARSELNTVRTVQVSKVQ